MKINNDNQLLTEYARHGSEGAFRELVQRHVNLVHSAALREARGDVSLAEDITQEVFTELARRASSLLSHPALAGWLYTAVRLMAANLRRTEDRRHRREQEAYTMNELLGNDASDQLWRQVRPVLDDVMHELNQEDRAAVVLRFFEGLSLKEVGSALGLTENAARMRVERSLEKLHGLLARRGVSSTAATLAAVLVAGAIVNAAPTLAASVATGALTTAAGGHSVALLPKLLTLAKSNSLAVGALAVLAMAPILWHSAGLADESLQARCEQSIKDAKSLPGVKIDFLETLWFPGTQSRDSSSGKPGVSRTFQYSWVESGLKFRATRKLVSPSGTNLVHLSESGFDGRVYYYYNDGYLAKGSANLNGNDAAETLYNPLSSPFMFLTNNYEGAVGNVLRLADVFSAGWTNALRAPVTEQPGGLLEISLPGPPLYSPPGLPRNTQPTIWKIEVDKLAAGFMPKTIEHIFPAYNIEVVSRFLDYTNLGAYHFPARVEFVECSYPPTSPPTLMSTGVVTLISAQIPVETNDFISDLSREEKKAVHIWDLDQNKFVKVAPRP